MDLKVDVPENEEGPSMGGAMLAAVDAGHIRMWKPSAKNGKSCRYCRTDRNWLRNMKRNIRNSVNFIQL